MSARDAGWIRMGETAKRLEMSLGFVRKLADRNELTTKRFSPTGQRFVLLSEVEALRDRVVRPAKAEDGGSNG
jgi:hypothetical protein